MRALVAFAIAAGIASAGCETFGPVACDRTAEGNPEVRVTAGHTEAGTYASAFDPDAGSPWTGELLRFPGGMRYELVHGLGATPRWIEAYLSFSRYGATDGGSLAQAAGNQVLITGADATSIHVANDSCVEYWLLVTAGTGAEPAAP